MAEEGKQAKPTRIRRRRRSLWSVVPIFFFALIWAVVLCFGLLFAVMQEGTVPVPEMFQRQLAKLIQNGDGPEITFDQVEVGFHDSIHPKIILFGVGFSNAEAATGVKLTRAELVADVWRIFGGEFHPRQVGLSGAVIDLTRKADGSFDYGLESLPSTASAGSVDDMIKQGEDLAKQRELDWLSNLRIDDLTVNYTDHRNQKAWTLDGGRLLATKQDGNISVRIDLALLTGVGDPATLAISYDRTGTNPGVLSADINNVHTQDLAIQSPALSWLQLIDARISGSLRTQQNATGLGILNAQLNFGVGSIKPGPAAEAIQVQSAKAYFSYTPNQRRLDVTQLEVATDKGQASGQGYALMQVAEDTGAPTGMVLHIDGEAAGLPVAGVLAPISIDHYSTISKLQFNPFALSLGDARLSLGGADVQASGSVDLLQNGWAFDLNANTSQISVGKILEYWPSNVAPKSRDWFEANLTKGTFSEVYAGLQQQPGTMPQISASFQFGDASVRYMKQMPPIIAARGYGLLQNNSMHVNLSGGNIAAPQGGGFDVSNSSMIIADITERPARAEFDLKGQGTITAALSLLDQPPFLVMQKASRPVDLVDGKVDLSATLSLPLQQGAKPEDISYDVVGTATNLRTRQIVPNKLMTAARVELHATPKLLEITGPVKVGGVSASGTWRQPLGPNAGGGTVKASIALSPQFLDEFNIALPPGTIRGSSQAALSLELAKGQSPTFALSSNLSGLGVSIPAVGVSLSRQQRGEFSISGRLSNPVKINGFSFRGQGIDASGSLSLTGAGQFDRAVISDLRLGNWLRSSVTIIGRGARKPVDLVLRGGQLNLPNAPFGRNSGGGGQGGASGQITANLDRLVISDTISLTGVAAELLPGSGLNGRFQGRVNGGTRVQGFAKQNNSGLVIEVTSADAGGAMRDAGLLKQANSGDMALTLRSQNGGWLGNLRVTDARVKDAPAVAELLSAVSVIGILEQLDGNGLLFNDIRAEFLLKDDLFTLYSSSAVGPSLGLSVDGFINTRTQQMDLQGVLSPFYLINALGSIFTRRGEGLIGFNFNLRGSTSDPKVAVNPLSAFTPGMFREIFRRPPPKQ